MTEPAPVDTTSPLQTITDLPDDPESINRIMYGRLLEQWKPLLAAFGHRPTASHFSIVSGGTGIGGSRALMTLNLGQRPQSDWHALEDKMTQVALAQGWHRIGYIAGLNTMKDGYYLRGGCAAVDGCIWELESSLIPHEGIAGGQWQGKTVNELLNP